MADLEPPRKSVEMEDSGAHELESSEGEEHFSDASEGKQSGSISPVPITRVERVDDKPSHGEVPGTEAYKIRTQDAVPDEVEVIPEGTRSRSTSRVSEGARSPNGTLIPRTVVEKVDDMPSHGEVPGTYAHELRKADAEPDEVIKSPENATQSFKGSPTASINRSRSPSEPLRTAPLIQLPPAGLDSDPTTAEEGGEDEVGFGDDFDDFEEGDEQDDFGEFDEGFPQPAPDAGAESRDQSYRFPASPQPYPFPPYSFADYSNIDEMRSTIAPYLEAMFPGVPKIVPREESLGNAGSIFTTERSTALWSQLIEPPPLQPPNWIRSRIRRMFLVSLGVPVDLDEILPASKQKKLVLPSISLSPRTSTEPASGAVERVRRQNDSSTSVNSTSSKAERKRRGPPPPPEFDISAAARLSSTTDAALSNFIDEELKAHVEQLKFLEKRAKEVHEYWKDRKKSALGDKEAFEGVIENLVKHAKKVRE
ncbi:MAG: hypothetical protein M1820_006257 [Bogoriella megaspora]|nr:MAG: hypothetical protein M1820_006257 [Bogoriella megaspora]